MFALASAVRLRPILALTTAVALAFSGACSSSADQPSSSDRGGEARRIIVDTDMGVDDVRALMFLIEHAEVEVIAISVTGTGLGLCPESGHNALALLDALGAPLVPVGCGTNRPTEGFNTFPTDLRNDAVELTGMDLDPVDVELPDAVEVMSEALASSDAPVTLLTLGPLTNVAVLVEDEPNLDKLDEIRMMGGAVDVGGNIISFSNFGAEFNVWIDPVAADLVFSSGLPLTLIPLDATNDVPLTPAFVTTLEAGQSTVASNMLATNLAAGGPVSSLYHWDDLAAASLVDDDVVVFETINLSVDRDLGSPSVGQTFRDPNGVAMRVAVEADRTSFEQHFFETISGEASTTDGLWEPASVIAFDGTNCTYEGPDPLGSEVSAKVDNTSDTPGLGVVFGTYDDDATADDIQAMVDGGFSAPPVFFEIHTLASLPANTISYVATDGIPSDTTIWCAAAGDVVELAGPKLRTP